MNRARVIGEVWATRKAEGLTGRKLLLLALDGQDRLVVGIDTLGAGVGDQVLVSSGSGARNVLLAGPDNRALLCDAAVSLVIDGASDDPGRAGREG